jgi:hypothetical protein
MKGIVFTEFIEMVEDKFGFEVADDIITKSKLESGGNYTAVGTYPHAEMVSLVTSLSNNTDIEVSVLLRVYGEHLFLSFVKLYGHFFENVPDCFTFLESIDNYIHREVLKLYPDAELPSFKSKRENSDTLIMHYKSERKMADFAFGLIEGSLKYFKEPATINMEEISDDKTQMKFTITKI